MAWTEERVEILKKLWAEGLSASQVANKLGGVTRNAVIGKIHRLGLSGRATSQNRSNSVTKTGRKPKQSKNNSTGNTVTYRASGNAALKTNIVEKPKVREAKEKKFKVIDTPPGERATILSLSNYTCRWPVGDPMETDFYFCGRKPNDSSPYCEHHTKMAYQAIGDRKKQKKFSA